MKNWIKENKSLALVLFVALVTIIAYSIKYATDDKAQNGAPQEGDKCHIPNIFDTVSTYQGELPLDGIIKNGKCVGRDQNP